MLTKGSKKPSTRRGARALLAGKRAKQAEKERAEKQAKRDLASLAQPAIVVGGGDANEIMHSNEEEETQIDTSFLNPFGDEPSQPLVDVNDNTNTKSKKRARKESTRKSNKKARNKSATPATKTLPAADAAAAAEITAPPAPLSAPEKETAMDVDPISAAEIAAPPAPLSAPEKETTMDFDSPSAVVENTASPSLTAPEEESPAVVENTASPSLPAREEETAMETDPAPTAAVSLVQQQQSSTLVTTFDPTGEDLTAASKFVSKYEGNNNLKETAVEVVEKNENGVIVKTHKATFRALSALSTAATKALTEKSRGCSPNEILLSKQAIEDVVLRELVNFHGGDENTKLEGKNPIYFSCYDSNQKEMIHVIRTNDMRLVPDNAPSDFPRLDKTGSRHIALFVVIIQKFSDVDKKKKPVDGNFVTYTSEEDYAKEKTESGWFIAPHDPTNKHFSPVLAMDAFKSVFGARFIVRFPAAQQSDPLKHKKLLQKVHKFVEEDDLFKFLDNMYPDPTSFEAKKQTVHMCFVRYINKCYFPELDPLSVKALGISLFPNLKNCLKQGGKTSLYARICEFLGKPRSNNPMSAQSVILQSGDPLMMRWLYRIDEEDQNDMYSLSSKLHHYMDILQKLKQPLVQAQNAKLSCTVHHYSVHNGSGLDVSDMPYRWKTTKRMYIMMIEILQKLQDDLASDDFEALSEDRMKEIAVFLPKTNYTSRVVYRAMGEDTAGLGETITPRKVCESLVKYLDSRIARICEMFNEFGVDIASISDVSIVDVMEIGEGQDPAKYTKDLFEEHDRAVSSAMMAFCHLDYKLRQKCEDLVGCTTPLPNPHSFAEIEMFLLANGASAIVNAMDNVVCADTLPFKFESSGRGITEVAKFPKNQGSVELTASDRVGPGERVYAFKIDKFHPVDIVDENERVKICQIIAGALEGERFSTDSTIDPTSNMNIWTANLMAKSIKPIDLAGSKVSWVSLADHTVIADPRACPFAYLDMIPGDEHYLALQDAGDVYSVFETLLPCSLFPDHIKTYGYRKKYLENHGDPIQRMINGFFRAIREFAAKRGGMEQRNSYIASIKSKIEKLENIITHLRNRINLQREIVDKDYDNESLSDAKREENAEKSNEVIRKWNNRITECRANIRHLKAQLT